MRKDGLRVKVKDTSAVHPLEGSQFTARMPGGYKALKPGRIPTEEELLDPSIDVTKGHIKVATVAEENCLYFEKLKDT